MKTHTIGGRILATLAGIAAAGASIYMICEDAIKSSQWTRDDIMMPIIVGVTIVVGHLVGCAWRARRVLSAAVFCMGSALVVYTSVGRQARVAETAEAKAEAIAAERQRIAGERVRLTKLRNDAQAMLDTEQAVYKAKCEDKKTAKAANCKVIKNSVDMYTGAVKGHSDALAELPSETELPPVEIVDARPDRVASAIAFFASNEQQTRATLKRGFLLFEPFAYSLFLELCAIVAFSFAFGHSRRQRVELVKVHVPAVAPAPQAPPAIHPAVPTIPKSVPTIPKSVPTIPDIPPKPAPDQPPKPRTRKRPGRKIDANVIAFSERYIRKFGRAPSGSEIKSEFPELPTSTAYDYAARARVSVPALRVVA
jgi:hypothetical protein